MQTKKLKVEQLMKRISSLKDTQLKKIKGGGDGIIIDDINDMT